MPCPGWKVRGSHVIEEDPGADHRAFRSGQKPAHRESAQILLPRLQQHLHDLLAMCRSAVVLGLGIGFAHLHVRLQGGRGLAAVFALGIPGSTVIIAQPPATLFTHYVTFPAAYDKFGVS
jgi:hypothetical protein